MNIVKKWNLMKHIIFTIIIVSMCIIIDTLVNISKYNKGIESIGGGDGPVAVFTAGDFLGLIVNKYTVIFIIIMLLYKPLKLLIYKLIIED
ncbi:hypothetical protein SH1V18_30500 [Vallitalea longa]|uniref:Uncharacterized protein n=1 Tax=Vallitalea longa TaxID=2936439 RepID=A0A9W6DFG7_9FIRM|nr:hypothetical protein [Vallitalea longa]GKX30570.1 hypothetical protein SH1V18_30500 [Vallitalea longa]